MSAWPRDDFWQAPLVPAALAATAGVLLDRWAEVPLALSLLGVVASVGGWALARQARQDGPALLCLWAAIAAVGAGYHHWRTNAFPTDDVGNFAAAEPRPVLLQGVLVEEPTTPAAALPSPLQGPRRPTGTGTTVRVRRLKQLDAWVNASGLARVTVAGPLRDLHVNDEVEIVGRLSLPGEAENPGGFDYSLHLRDQGIRAVVQVEGSPEGVTRLASLWWLTRTGWQAALRGWGHRTLQELLPKEQRGLAQALLLGEDWALPWAEWEKYQRTGVIHVLAISGQHLVVLSGFAWLLLRPLQVPRRRCAGFVALFLLGYALLTGGRPPVLRAAVVICALCPALLLHRCVLRANTFALAWLAVLALNPADIFTTGCQLSFLAVAVLFWAVPHLTVTPADPLDRLREESRPVWAKVLGWLGKQVVLAYVVGLVIWLALAPLIAARTHIVSLSGLVVGPPVVLLSTIALLTGFLTLLLAPLCWPLAGLAAWVTGRSLAGCDLLVTAAEGWPASYWYVPDLPAWWLYLFYAALLAALTQESLRSRWRALGMAGLGWVCVGLVSGAVRQTPAELRCTFLAVGHGGCTVLETPDGRNLLYDAGAISGSDVTRRCIAPFLWSRGITRIDEVLLSHADMDHFNGLPALLERFTVGQVTCTPSFQDRQTPAVALTLETLRRRGVPVRVVCAGDRLTAGEVEVEVLHPPPAGPEGNENARSLVLLVSHQGHHILLTGDLEGPGLEQVLSLPPPAIDVLQAPHHGSKTANRPELAAWARPRVVVSCQGPTRWPLRGQDAYTPAGARLLTTWEHGAVTVRSSRTTLTTETHRTGERWLVGP